MRIEASHELLAAREDVWRFLAEPYHLADWWPTISAVRPDARGFREGARWEVAGPSSPTLFRKGGATGIAIVKTIELHERVVWSLTADRLDVEVRLRSLAPDRTLVTVAVEGAWRPEALGRPRALPRMAAHRLYELVQTAASLGAPGRS
ncbi:MAG TPA: SRPBCC domain-containing protein [Gaiellaceae bacterium]|nr:SRPBCC domain-containing protein [Gaiellaceae bacterium]